MGIKIMIIRISDCFENNCIELISFQKKMINEDLLIIIDKHVYQLQLTICTHMI